MTPPCKVFSPADLESEIQKDFNGKKRKGNPIDLAKCPLLSMVQYDCQIDRPEVRNSPVRCYQVQRWFRRCQDLKGQFMVETTHWENRKEVGLEASKAVVGEAVPLASQVRGAGVDRDGWVKSWR